MERSARVVPGSDSSKGLEWGHRSCRCRLWVPGDHLGKTFPSGQKLRCGAVEGELSDGEADEAEAHQDGRDDADEERTVVATPDTLVQPLAVVVEYVNTLVANAAVFCSGGRDIDPT